MGEIFIPAGAGESEFTEKRSRFLGHLRPVSTEDEARNFLSEVKAQHHDARHNCWCYVVDGGQILRYSDDGEPQGTAGQPMLAVFTKAGVSGLCCVVTRYFGGVLLGAGGLVRAYTRAAKDALNAAGIAVLRPWQQLRIPCEYSWLQRVKLEIQRCGGEVSNIEYGAGVTVEALLSQEQTEPFSTRLTDMTAGTVTVEAAGTVMRAERLN